MTSILLTRPQIYAGTLTQTLCAQGYEVLDEPMLRIEPLSGSGAPPRPPIEKPFVVLITSRSAVLALAQRPREEIADLLRATCYCVGQQTKEDALALGFQSVISADEDAAALARLVLECETQTQRTHALHIGGEDRSLEPGATLQRHGWQVIPWVVYKAVAAQSLSDQLCERLKAGALDVALFFSPRSASLFVDLVQRHGLQACCKTLSAIGLSPAVGEALQPLGLGKLLIAQSPAQDSLLEKLYEAFPVQRNEGPMSETIENPPQDELKDTIVQEPPPAPEEKSCANDQRCPSEAPMGLKLLAFLIVVFAVLFYFTAVIPTPGLVTPQSIDSAALAARIDTLDVRLKQIEKGLSEFDARAKTGADGQTLAATGGPASQDIDALKANLVGLSNALGTLQSELEKSTKAASDSTQNVQVGLSTLLGYVQLQRAALSSRPFEKERLDLRKVAEGDATLVDLLVKMEPYALTGVEGPQALLKEWGKTESDAQAALRKAGAQTWIDRLVVAIEGLVSIRPLSPKANDSLAFGSITLDLEQGNLAEAQTKVAALPNEVQGVIAPWRTKLDSRAAVEASLNAIAAHLLTRGASPEAQPPQPLQPTGEAPAAAPPASDKTGDVK